MLTRSCVSIHTLQHTTYTVVTWWPWTCTRPPTRILSVLIGRRGECIEDEPMQHHSTHRSRLLLYMASIWAISIVRNLWQTYQPSSGRHTWSIPMCRWCQGARSTEECRDIHLENVAKAQWAGLRFNPDKCYRVFWEQSYSCLNSPPTSKKDTPDARSPEEGCLYHLDKWHAAELQEH